jgi:hypothetical protein
VEVVYRIGDAKAGRKDAGTSNSLPSPQVAYVRPPRRAIVHSLVSLCSDHFLTALLTLIPVTTITLLARFLRTPLNYKRHPRITEQLYS